MIPSTEREFRRQLESLHSISVEVAMLHELPQVLERTIGYCLDLTGSQFGFVGLLDASRQLMDVAAIKGFEPTDPTFYERFRQIPVRPNLFDVVIREARSNISNDVLNDPQRVGQPRGHPPVRRFLGVPLRAGPLIIGMIGVANRESGYTEDDARLLSTFANEAAVAIENTRLYESQRAMIERLEVINRELREAERERATQRERERIAAEVHDGIDQALFTVGLRINSALETQHLTSDMTTYLLEIRDVVARAAHETKHAIFAMSSDDNRNRPLEERLRRCIHEAPQGTNLGVDLVVSGTPASLEPNAEQALYHVVRSSLLNVVMHARASSVLVSLDYAPDSVQVAVQDDGTEAPEPPLLQDSDDSEHMGLNSMKSLVEDAGGTFTVRRGEDGGFVVRASVPISERP